jgi:antitoxin HicB
MKSMKKKIGDYLKLPYTRELVPEPEGGWFVRIKELPGCISQGDTPQEALAMIDDALRGWLEVALQHGEQIPQPREETDYSGKFMLRLPRWLHRRLVEMAQQEGVSLNHYLNTILAASAGNETHKLSVSLHGNQVNENQSSYAASTKRKPRDSH